MLIYMLTAVLKFEHFWGYLGGLALNSQVTTQFWVVTSSVQPEARWHGELKIHTCYVISIQPKTFNWKTHFDELKSSYTKTSSCLENIAYSHPYILCRIGIQQWQHEGKNKSRGRLSVSSIMSVFLPKRVKVGSQIDAYWGILSLLDLYFLQQSRDRGWFKITTYSTVFPLRVTV